MTVEELIELQDIHHLMSSRAIGSQYSLPYIYPTSRAVGFKSLKLKINKKISKPKM